MNPAVGDAREQLRQARKQLHHAWLQLVRAPNLFTAVGDPVAGACLAAAGGSSLAVGPLIIAASCAAAVYAGGMVDNDLVDLETDRAERPQRPLPSGAVPVRQARKGRLILFLAPYMFALAYRMPLAWVAAHALLLLACLAYNRLKTRSMAIGAALMGLCRVLSFAAGFALVGGPGEGISTWLLVAALPWFLYVGAICLFAAREMERVPGSVRHLLALPPLLLLAGGFVPTVPPAAALALKVAGLCGVACVLDVTCRLGRGSQLREVPPAVGRLVRAVVPMQAVLCLASPSGVAPCMLLLLCWILAERVGRRFYAS